MKLFYKPGACSLASHITLRESGKDFTLVSVDLTEDLLEIGHGDLLAFGNLREGDGGLLFMQGQVHHGRDGKSSFGRQLQDAAPI